MKAACGHMAFCLVAFTLWMPCLAAQAQSDSGPLVPVDLHVGFTRSSFLGVNEADARAAFKVFAKRMGQKRGYRITPYIRIYDDIDELEIDIGRGRPGLLIINTWDYLTIAPCSALPAVFSTVEQGVLAEEYLLLARAEANFSTPADLKEKHVIVLDSTNASNGRHWLRTEIMALGVAAPRDFFGRFEIKAKTSQVVLPVFFGRADACVVDRSGFEIMAEMNPQVGTKLRVVTRSEPYLDTLACVRIGGWEAGHHRGDLIEALVDIQEDPAGKQIMDLFRFNGLRRHECQHLDTIRALRHRHDALAAELAAGTNKKGTQ